MNIQMPTRSRNETASIPGGITNNECTPEFLKLLDWCQLVAAHARRNKACVEEHRRELQAQGETAIRLDEWKCWRQSLEFSAKEKAAFALSEAISLHESEDCRSQVLEAARLHLSMEEIVRLVLLVMEVNDWINLQKPPPRVLIVEDDPADRDLLLRQLKKSGMTENVLFLPDGKQALEDIEDCEKLEEWNLIALFLDLHLPELSGIELLRRIRQMPGKQDLPVIVITGSDDPREMAECQKLGVMSYVNKPVSFSSFSKAVANLFHRAHGG